MLNRFTDVFGKQQELEEAECGLAEGLQAQSPFLIRLETANDSSKSRHVSGLFKIRDDRLACMMPQSTGAAR